MNRLQNGYVSAILESFAALPEWMQVLCCDRGMRMSLEYSNDSMGDSLAGHRLIGINMNMLGLITIFRNKSLLHSTLREELLHGLQKGLSNTTIDLLHEEAVKLQKAMRRNPGKSLALELIKKFEPGGGSFLEGRGSQAGLELLVDVIEAEYYLRQTEGKSRAEAERDIRRAFGNTVYDLSQSFVKECMEEAEHILQKQIGAEKASRHAAKWREDPLGHHITLPHLPKYNLAARFTQKPGP